MRKVIGIRASVAAAFAMVLWPGVMEVAWADGGTKTLSEVLKTARPDDRIPVIVTLAERAELAAFTDSDKHLRRRKIIEALQSRANLSQGPILRLMNQSGATRVRPLWVVNGVAASVKPDLLRALLRFPGVVDVTLDAVLKAPVTTLGTTAAPEWNISAINAPRVWSLGRRGAGAVVANMDTGVDINHVDLKSKWRGGNDSWWDPWKKTTVPYDAIGHGTQTMGIMVGGSSGGTAIGVAPDAKWIAAKIYDDQGNTTLSVIHQSFQWLLAPSGNLGAPDAPDVVNASWGMASVNACDTTFHNDFEALRAAGIVIAFAGGNAGPNAWTSVSPANNQDGFSAGAIDSANAIADFSSRGASACTNGVFPDVVAPGVNVVTSDISFAGTPQYVYVSGTSFAAPHVAGAAALLAGAFPAATTTDIERALRSTARDLGPVGPDNTYGRGLLDAYAAYQSLAGTTAVPLVIVTASPLQSGIVGHAYPIALVASGGVTPYSWSVAFGLLPPGLRLGSLSGSIYGTPTTRGTFGFTAAVRDAKGTVATHPYSLTIQ